MQNFSFQYPSWLLAIIIIGAIAYALLLYFRTVRYAEKPSTFRWILGVMRFLSIGLIGLLLLGPLFNSIQETSKKPLVAIALDQSESIAAAMDETERSTLIESISSLQSTLTEKYDVDLYTFGAEIQSGTLDSMVWDGGTTDIATAVKYISDVYEGENLGAFVLATDGIYNAGKNPIYEKYNHTSPIMSIALGDTTRRNDLILKNVFHNEIAYLDDQMKIQVDVQAYNSNGSRTRLTIQKKQGEQYTTIATRDLYIDDADYFSTQEFTLDMNTVGVSQYRLSLSPLPNESNRVNNSKNIYIEVLDARQQIHIIANAPHPDIATLRQVIERNKNYEVVIHDEIPNSDALRESDLVILHNLPSEKNKIESVLSYINQRKLPRLYVVGSQTDLRQLNAIQDVVNINGQNGVMNDAEPVLNEEFSSFNYSQELKDRLRRYPPLKSPFGEYSLNGQSEILLYQKIGNIDTDFPMLAYSDQNGLKSSYLLGENIWKWKYYDYVEDAAFEKVAELIDQSIVYTTTKEDRRKFRVSHRSNVYQTNENINFSAELYNSNYELINESDVTITISDQDGNEFDYTFSPEGRAYRLNAGQLPAGSYRYTAQTTFNAENYTTNGSFTIREVEYELYDLEANHNVLYALSQRNNGQVYYPAQINQVAEDLLNDERLKPIIYQRTQTDPAINLKWIFGLLALLFAGEWFLRRYYGSI